MFIIRTDGETPSGSGFSIRLRRRTPALAFGGTHDFFCEGDPAAAAGFNVVALHDGWYADDTGGGVAIWGHGRFWEIRDTPFTVRESSSGAPPESNTSGGDSVNVRQAIFGV